MKEREERSKIRKRRETQTQKLNATARNGISDKRSSQSRTREPLFHAFSRQSARSLRGSERGIDAASAETARQHRDGARCRDSEFADETAARCPVIGVIGCNYSVNAAVGGRSLPRRVNIGRQHAWRHAFGPASADTCARARTVY